jgi:ribonuclease HI
MSFLVIDRKCMNKIYTVGNPEIELYSFKTKEEAEYYLQYGHKKKIDTINKIKVFTDGACSMNGTKNAKAGIGVYFKENDKRNVSRRITGKQTNNTAELSAVIEVFHVLNDEIKNGINVEIYTDSDYVIRCCTTYGEKCEKSNWRNTKGYIVNHELVKTIYEFFKNNKNVQIFHVKAHTGNTDELSIGNHNADKLANDSLNT